ncbi:MAG TPA: diguanylate cyclase [Solirubrobacteraceae bacterium]|nr:diguanylate cyclase [Solirubrobacteraceae bacterium]
MADAPVAELVADAQQLARDWLIEMLSAIPLDQAASVPVARLAAEGPALCAAIVRALADDRELGRLGSQGDLGPRAAQAGSLAGASEPPAVAAAVETLRRVLWAATDEQLRRPSPQQVSDLANRLAHVCAVVLAASLTPAGAPPPRATMPSERRSEEGGTRRDGEEDPDRGPGGSSAPAERPPPSPFVEPEIDGPMSLVDQRLASADGGRPWLEALERRLARQARGGSVFATLLIELDGVERLLASETGHEVATAIDAVERAICQQLRPADALMRESLGRYWLITPDTDASGAGELADRLAGAVGQAASLRGAPLTISIGMAVAPADGDRPEGLADVAEEALFAARATGRHRVVGDSAG